MEWKNQTFYEVTLDQVRMSIVRLKSDQESVTVPYYWGGIITDYYFNGSTLTCKIASESTHVLPIIIGNEDGYWAALPISYVSEFTRETGINWIDGNTINGIRTAITNSYGRNGTHNRRVNK